MDAGPPPGYSVAVPPTGESPSVGVPAGRRRRDVLPTDLGFRRVARLRRHAAPDQSLAYPRRVRPRGALFVASGGARDYSRGVRPDHLKSATVGRTEAWP